MEGESKAQLPNIKNKAILYKDVEVAKESDSKAFFYAETINAIAQEDVGPAVSQVVDVVNDSVEIN